MPADLRVDSLAALARRYGSNTWRRVLLHRLGGVLAELREIGWRGDLYIGGSFITSKRLPLDVDVVLDCGRLDPASWTQIARYVLSMADQWQAFGVGTHTWHPSMQRSALDVLRRDRRGRRRQLVVVATAAART
jgi:hypothetical protein